MIKKKSWSTRDSPNQHLIQDNKNLRITVFGAIGNCLTEPVFTLKHGTKSSNYVEFLHDVVARLKPNTGKPVLFFDGLRSHMSKESLPTVIQYFRPL